MSGIVSKRACYTGFRSSKIATVSSIREGQVGSCRSSTRVRVLEPDDWDLSFGLTLSL